MKTNPISSVLQRNGLSEGLGRDVLGASVALEKSREFALQILQLVEVTHTLRQTDHVLERSYF
jgi:hypothetical protein